MAGTQELSFPGADDDTLAGSLALPEGDGPHPGALLLVGSGEVDRDSDHHKLPLGITREVAEALAQAGIASLRYDKRGVRASRGSYLETTFADARGDAAAALTTLRSHVAVDPDRVLVIGHSEGALHATSLAAREPTLAGVGLLAAPASTGEVTMRWQAEVILPTLPAPIRGLLRVLRQSPERAQAKLFEKVRATDDAVMRVQGKRVNAGWLRGFIDHDPAPDLRRIAVPVFALTGDRDLQVDPGDLAAIASLVVRAPVEVHRVPHVNHLLRHTEGSGSPAEYKRQISSGQPLDERVLVALTHWAIATVSGATRG